MHQAVFVSRRDRAGDHGQHASSRPVALSRERLIDVLPVEKLHYDRGAVFAVHDRVNRHDVRVADSRGRAGLGDELRTRRISGLPGQDLQSDRPVELDFTRTPHDAQTAGADARLDPETRDLGH